jgi:hypothetical protein
MELSEFRNCLARSRPPAGLSPALAALWWAGKDDWEKAHEIVMEEAGRECAWVHAYLHRLEGDLDNARYWYRKADRPASSQPPAAEWEAIVETLLVEPDSP